MSLLLSLLLVQPPIAHAAPEPTPDAAQSPAGSPDEGQIAAASAEYREGDAVSAANLAGAASEVRTLDLEETDDGFSARTPAGVMIDIGDDGILLSKPGKAEVGIAIEGIDAASSQVVEGALVETGVAPGVDAVTWATPDGVQLILVLADADAPRSLDFSLILEDGVHAQATAGGVLMTTSEGQVVGGLTRPWARDAKGNEVRTWFVVDGDRVSQVVAPTEDAEYPIVADPYLFMDMIKSASWSKSSLGWTLKVTPTTAARAFGGAYLAGVAGRDELYSKYKNKGLNTNLDGMRDQYICHQQFAFLKDTWNLDEYRKNVSYADTVAASCNPPVKK